MKKRVTILLNISLGLWIAYYVLFFMGYFAQKPLIWRFFIGDAQYLSELEPVFSPVIIGFSLVIAAGAVIFNLLLRKNNSSGLLIAAEVFAAIAFAADRLVKWIAPMVKTIMLGRFAGSDGVYAGGLHTQSVNVLDMVLLVFFAASLTLMVCACCVTQFERRAATQ